MGRITFVNKYVKSEYYINYKMRTDGLWPVKLATIVGTTAFEYVFFSVAPGCGSVIIHY